MNQNTIGDTHAKSSIDEIVDEFKLSRETSSEVNALENPAPKSNPPSKPPKMPTLWKEFISLGIRIGIILLVAVIALTFVYGIHIVNDPGMMPATHNGDIALFYRLNRNYAINDLILLEFEGTTQIRRVIAREGDVVDIAENGGLIINGSRQSDPHAIGETWAFEEGIEFPVTVPPGEIFVLGDARERATDSRIYGTVRTRDIIGRVITIIRRRNL